MICCDTPYSHITYHISRDKDKTYHDITIPAKQNKQTKQTTQNKTNNNNNKMSTEQTTSEKMTKWCNDVYDAILSDDRAGLSKLLEMNISKEQNVFMDDALGITNNKMGVSIRDFLDDPYWTEGECSWETEGVSEETREFASDLVDKVRIPFKRKYGQSSRYQ